MGKSTRSGSESVSIRQIVGIPSSFETGTLAQEIGILLITFADRAEIDLTIDGADEVDPQLNLIKGGGGALLRGIDLFVNEQLGVPVRVADDPLTTVARGTAICLEHLAQWRDSLDSGDGEL